MADERYTTVARPKDYWMSPKALSITLNALEEANRIAASVTGGSQFFCHFEDVGDLQVEELFGYDVGHNFRSWPLAISPTWFNTSQRIYIHIAIPRRDRRDAQALLVFPTQRLDLWGYATYSEPMTDDEGNLIDEYGNVVDDPSEAATAYVRKKKSEYSDEDADPVGSQDYYYIYLHGQLTEPFYRNGVLVRDWDPEIDTGRLNTDETWGEVITIEQLAREMKKKVDVEWFQRIFTIHGTDRKRVVDYYDENGDPVYATDPETGEYIWDGLGDERDIRPNDMDHEITDTESMFGTWTQQWLSALGMGSGSGSGGGGDALLQPLLSINTMETIPTAVGQTLVWRGTGQGINGSGWDFGTAGMDGTELATWLFNNNYKPQGDLDLRYLRLDPSPATEQAVSGDLNLNDSLYLLRTPVSDFTAVSDSLVLSFGETKAYFAGKYVTIDWFNRVFETYTGTTKRDVNDPGVIAGTTVLDNLKILVGTWTNSYLSALGQGAQGSGGSSGGGGTPLLQPLLSINTMEALPTAAGQTLVWRGTGQGINGSGWAFGTAGLDASAMDSRMRTNYSWWGQHMNAAGEVTGDITVGIGDIILNNERKIRWKKSTGDTSYSMLTIDGSNNFIVGEAATAANEIDTYVRGRAVYFQSASGSVDASLTQPATGDTTPVFYVKKLKIGSITISEDTQNGGLHVENAGLYADTFLSALGAGSQGGSGGMDLDAMWGALGTNDSSHKIHNSHLNFNISNYALRTEIPSLNGYATESWVSSHFNNYEHPTGGANTTINASDGKVLSSITVNSLGHVTAVGSKTLAAADIPSLNASKITDGQFGDARISAVSWSKITGKPTSWWGRSTWDSNGAVTGSLSSVGSISMSSTITGCTSIDSLLYFDTEHNGIGIGTSTTNYDGRAFKLNVNGHVRATSLEAACFGGPRTDTWKEPESVTSRKDRLWYGYDRIDSDSTHDNSWHTTFSDYFGMTFHTRDGWLCMTQTGNVGIGTTAPTAKLDVNGRAMMDGIDFHGFNDSASTPHHHGGYLDFHYQASTADYTTRIIESANGVLSILKSSGATGLVVGGTAAANADYIKIGGATLTWDNTNQALHIDKGVYSDSFVSSLGMGSGGTSGGGTLYGLSLTSTTLKLVPDGTSSSVNLGNTFMTLGTTQTVSGAKTFSSTLTVSSNGIEMSDGTGIRVNNGHLTHYKNSAHVNVIDAEIAMNYCLGLQSYDSTPSGATIIDTSVNVNNIKSAGTYCCKSAASITGQPARGNYRLWHIVNSGTDNSSSQNAVQVALYTSNAKMYLRSYVSGTFGNWNEVATTGNVVTLSATQTISGAKTFTGGVTASALSISNNGTLSVIGSMSTLEIEGERINNKGTTLAIQSNTTAKKDLTLCTGGGKVGICGAVDDTCDLKVTGTSLFSSNVGIGGYNSSYKLYVSGTAYVSQLRIGSNIRLYPTGVADNAAILDISAAGLRLNGTNITSDMRKKDVVSMVDDLTVENIARAPIFNFKWKQWPDGLTYVGTSAQYWDTVLPNAVLYLDDIYSLDYGATALAAAVMTARTVLTHEEQIAALTGRLDAVERENKAIKEENAWLKQEIELLKAA